MKSRAATLSGFSIDPRLETGSDFAEILRQTGDGFSVLGFILDAVKSRENARMGFRAANARGKSGDGVQANRGSAFATMRERHFHAVGETGKGDFQVGIVCQEVFKGLHAGSNHGNGPPTSYAESRFGELHFGWRPIRSLRDGEWKYIDSGAPELYHVQADKAERDNIAGTHPDTAAGMAKVLGALANADPATAHADPTAAERLRSLGYVTGRVELGAADGDPRRDIVRYEAYVKTFNAAAGALENGRARDAEATFRQLTREFPDAFEAHQYLARALVARHATKEAIAELELSIQLSPREPVLYFDAARALADEGEFDRAFRRVDEGRRLEPTSFYAPLTEGVVARAAGQTVRAEHAFEAALQMNPTLAPAHYELGAIAESRNDRDRARLEYQHALDDDPTLDIARAGLARLAR